MFTTAQRIEFIRTAINDESKEPSDIAHSREIISKHLKNDHNIFAVLSTTEPELLKKNSFNGRTFRIR